MSLLQKRVLRLNIENIENKTYKGYKPDETILARLAFVLIDLFVVKRGAEIPRMYSIKRMT